MEPGCLLVVSVKEAVRPLESQAVGRQFSQSSLPCPPVHLNLVIVRDENRSVALRDHLEAGQTETQNSIPNDNNCKEQQPNQPYQIVLFET